MKCEVLWCKNRSRCRPEGVSFHRFPAYGGLRNLWKKAIGRENMVTKLKSHICSVHFHPKDLYTVSHKTLLTKDAVPALHLTNENLLSSDEEMESAVEIDSEEVIVPEANRVENTTIKGSASLKTDDITVEVNSSPEKSFAEPSVPICCIQSCPSNKQNAGIVRLFTVPDDAKRRSIWTNILSDDNVKFVKGSRICHRHFEDRFIVKGGSYIGQDGVEKEYENMNWRLTEDAVPSTTLIEHSIKEKVILPRLPEKKFKVEKTCRTCSIEIEDEKDATPLFTGSLSLQKFRPDIFKELEEFGLKIEENDGLPQQICQKCLQSFSILIQFRKQCQRVQIDLVKYFKDSKQQRMRSSDSGVITLCDNYSDDEGVSMIHRNSVDLKNTEDSYDNNEDIGDDDIILDDDILSENEQNFSDEENSSANWTCEYYIGAEEKTGQQRKKKLKRKAEAAGDEKPKKNGKNSSKVLSIITHHAPTPYDLDQSETTKQRKRCKLCQRLTSHCCKNCPEEPRLCLEPCFAAYHDSAKQMQEENDPELFQCEDCSRCFKTEVRMSLHFLKCSRRSKRESKELNEMDTNIRCEVCREECKDKEALEYHMKDFHPDGDLTPICRVCGRKFRTIKSLDAHLSRSHRLTGQDYKCNDCDRLYPSEIGLKEHIKRIHEKGTFECDICGYKLNNAREFRIHKNGHHQKKNFKCQYCEKKFISNRKKSEHESIHTGAKPHLCELCGRSFPFKQGFIEHVKGHTGSTEFKCDLCQKGFATKRKLYNHRLVHINGNYKALNCKLCDQKYERENLIASHMEVVHGVVDASENVENFQLTMECEICKRKFSSEDKISNHKKLRHDPEQPYECEFCGCRYRRKDNLGVHIARMHEKNKSYECEICHKKYFCLNELDQHLSSHSNEKRHQCQNCPKKFKSLKGLQYHLKQHTMEIYPNA